MLSLKAFLIFLFMPIALLTISGCDKEFAWNDPYPYEDKEANARFSAFSERPKHLDPARSYVDTEFAIIGQIYESPFQYHYLKRPYALEPLTAIEMPKVYYFNTHDEKLPDNASEKDVAYTEYWISLKKNIFYQPHPAFAKDENGNARYLNLTEQEAKKYKVLSDFQYSKTDTKELTADDYVYQIKRLAEPSLASPIFGLMSQYIEGLAELRQTLEALPKNAAVETGKETGVEAGVETGGEPTVKTSVKTGVETGGETTAKTTARTDVETSGVERDLRQFDLKGATVIDRYTYKIRIKGKYPQFKFWLTLPFFTAVPWEVAQFYANPKFISQNLTLDWYPVGTGAYMLTENNPERRMILIKNPNFHPDFYPEEGTPNDKAEGLLINAGKLLPMIDKVIFSLEKEAIPSWTKFLQGYYDISGISSDNFTQAIQFGNQGNPEVSPLLKERGIRLQTSVTPGVWYWGFNMLDETVGGQSERARNLRHAIAAAVDVDEFLAIFLNDRGMKAEGPIPPEIFGYEAQSYQKWTLEQAKTWVKEAGLWGSKIYYDAVSTGSPDETVLQVWLQNQLEKIGLELIARTSDFNRYQEKVRQGRAQMFFWGWSNDYPDPENFLFLFYSKYGSAKYGGENTVNYDNPEFDALFVKMRGLEDGPERFAVIKRMTEILNKDQPWVYGFYPKSFALYHAWTSISKPSGLIQNSLKYVSVDAKLRAAQQKIWNAPIVWPLWGIFLLILLINVPAGFTYYQLIYKKKLRV